MRLIINGVLGKLGRAIADYAKGKAEVTAGADTNAETAVETAIETAIETRFPTYKNLNDIIQTADALIDCSFHGAVYDVLDFAKKTGIPAIIATTGHTDAEMTFVNEASGRQPVFMSANMSLGINLLIELSQIAARLLGDRYDIEIVEAHHNRKIDAPSGTALMIAEALRAQLDGDYGFMYDRTKNRTPREKQEIGIHSVRGGGIIGLHDVIFAGNGEVISIKHQALSRDAFAEGALAAAFFMLGKPPGFYNMKSMLQDVL